MKLLVLTVVLQLVLTRADVSETFINRTRLAAQPSAETDVTTCDGHRHYSICDARSGERCDTVKVCMGAVTEYRHCYIGTPDKPFCNKGECSDEPEISSTCSPRALMCSEEGWFPDPQACSLYHYCEGQSLFSEIYQCPSGYVYNAESTLCMKKQSDADCIKVECDHGKIWLPYGSSKQYFAYCQAMGATFYFTYMLRCPPGTEFNGSGCSMID